MLAICGDLDPPLLICPQQSVDLQPSSVSTPMMAARTTESPAPTSRAEKPITTALKPAARKRRGTPIPAVPGSSRRRNGVANKPPMMAMLKPL
jgi:hypothetical protein